MKAAKQTELKKFFQSWANSVQIVTKIQQLYMKQNNIIKGKGATHFSFAVKKYNLTKERTLKNFMQTKIISDYWEFYVILFHLKEKIIEQVQVWPGMYSTMTSS